MLPEALLQEFSDFLAVRLGMHFGDLRRLDLVRRLGHLARDFGFSDVEPCLRWLMAAQPDRAQVETLAHHLSVDETYFFRDPAVFAALEQHVLPPLIARRRDSGRRLRIWSAGCCTGEEAYSMAILLSRLIPDLDRWHVTLLGTDINPQFLARARRGRYRPWSFRGVAPELRERHFSPAPRGTYQIAERHRRLADFQFLNLAQDAFPSLDNNTVAMDLVFCRNVLMYFEPAVAAAVVQRLKRCLVDGGWLIGSAAETTTGLFGDFTAVPFPGCTLYRKHGELFDDGVPPPRPVALPEVAAALPAPFPSLPVPAGGEPVAAPAPDAMAGEPAPAPYEAALADYRTGAYGRVIAQLPGELREPRDLALRARAAANLGRLDEARRWCEAAIAADKLNPGLRYLHSVILEEDGLVEEAAAVLRQALYLDQDFILAHFALGNLSRRRGRSAQATRHFGHALRLLRGLPPDSPLPDSDGLTARRLRQIIEEAECAA